METKKYNLYRDAILSQYPKATDVRTPDVCGSQDNVLFAKTPVGERVFKFSTEDMVKKNARVSYVYSVRGIPTPKITPREYKNLHFEDYAKIDGTTLHGAIQMGMDEEQVKAVYRSVLKEFVKMERICPQILGGEPLNYGHNVAGRYFGTKYNMLVGQLVRTFMYLIDNTNEYGLFHFDLSPKNIIVSDDGSFKSMIDLESAAICSKSIAFAMLASRYQQLGFDIKDLFKHYNTLTDAHLDYGKIVRLANFRRMVSKIR